MDINEDHAGFYKYTPFDADKWLSIENFTVNEKLTSNMSHIEGEFLVFDENLARTVGIYEEDGVRIVVMPTGTKFQKINYQSNDFKKLKHVLADLRDGNINPKYPLSRAQNAPSYEELAKMVKAQAWTITDLNANLELSKKINQEAQNIINDMSVKHQTLQDLVRDVREKVLI
jgi:hypothetical protein